MSLKLNVVKLLAKELKSCDNAKYLSAEEFVEMQFPISRELSNDDEAVIRLFLVYKKHEQVLELICRNFLERSKLRNINDHNLKLLIFLIIFTLSVDNFEDFMIVLEYIDCSYIFSLLSYFMDEDNLIYIAQQACLIFENEYCFERIIRPLQNKQQIINNLIVSLRLFKKCEHPKKEVTIAIEPKVLKKRFFKPPPPPANTPKPPAQFVAQPAPKYPEAIPQVPQKIPLRSKKKTPIVEAKPKSEFDCNFKAHKLPPRSKNIPQVKTNITTTLREASTHIKEQLNEVKKIEEILQGSFTREKLEHIEEQHRQEQQQLDLQLIERRHLEGLITYEEAILARKNVIKVNQAKMEEFKSERELLMQKLKSWKVEEQAKAKALVEKAQEIEKAAKQSEKKLQEERQSNAKLLQFETKQLLDAAAKKQEEEMRRKMDLIHEIHTLHEISLQTNLPKEFDPTECGNYGLLCEMSIAELQERLVLLKAKMEEDMETKRKCILTKKQKQQEMIENVKNFLAQTRRMSKSKSLPSTIKLDHPDLIELRKKLEEKKKLRKNLQ